jgi:uncharacterized protein (TIGR02145 family)
MKKSIILRFFPLIMMGLVLILINGCKKEMEEVVDSSIIIFNPDLTYGTMSDIDGNTYKTIQIGTQTWMAENLKVTKYSNGSAIPLVTDEAAWAALTTPGYCWYDNDAATHKGTYGALYNWYVVDTVSNGSKNVCPMGWHVPTDAEWTSLITYLGGEDIAGGKLKETGKTHWKDPNQGATNESGFTALPGGLRSLDGVSYNIGISGSWWSSTEYLYPYGAYLWSFGYIDSKACRSYNDGKINGLSVRCVKDK